MQGASPLASPRLNPRGTGSTCQSGTRRGLVSGVGGSTCRCGTRRRAKGGQSPANPAFSLFPAPIPPAPLPGGKGESQSLFRRGLRPRRPCTEPLAALINFVAVVPCGGVPSLPPANPTFSFVSCPYPPDPLPGGKGETKVFFMQGAAPLASPALNRLRHWLDLSRGRAFSLARLSCF